MTVRPITGFTAGVYDMFHIGHLNVIRQAESCCDRLVVGVSTDELVMQTKGKFPVIPFDERVEIVAAIRGVDDVVAQTTLDKVVAWEQVRYDRLFVGDDHRGQPSWLRYEAELRPRGVEIVYFPYTRNTSSTILRERLLALPSSA
jgi:glycerol-3-phosphate cytidylyltransferase